MFWSQNREHWVVESGRIENRIHRWLDIRFPEYTQAFKEIFTPRSLATLRSFPTPSDLAVSNTRANGGNLGKVYVSPWWRCGACEKRLNFLNSLDVALGTLSLWRRTNGSYSTCWTSTKEFEKSSTKPTNGFRSLLPEIPCADLVRSVGVQYQRRLPYLAFGGDLRKLAHGNQLLRKAGLNLAERSSGKYKGKIKLTKRGNSLLRKHLYFTVFHLLSHNQPFRHCMHTTFKSNGCRRCSRS